MNLVQGGRAALNQHLFKVTFFGITPGWRSYLSLVESHILNFRAIAADKATTMGHISTSVHSKVEAKCSGA